MHEIQTIIQAHNPKVQKVTLLILFSKNHDSSGPLEIIQKNLGEMEEKYGVEVSCSPLG
jgi:hypothetical protein